MYRGNGTGHSLQAASLTDAEPQQLLEETCEILDRYLDQDPERRTMAFREADPLPGLDGPVHTINTSTESDDAFNRFLTCKRYAALANRLLALIHEAISWAYEQATEEETDSRYWPVPLDTQLEIVSEGLGRAP